MLTILMIEWEEAVNHGMFRFLSSALLLWKCAAQRKSEELMVFMISISSRFALVNRVFHV